MTARCYVCGSAGLAADADPRSPTCAGCKPARAHVVSMQGPAPDGFARAVCPCGWRYALPWGDHHAILTAKVTAHWQDVIAGAAQAVAA